MHISVALRSPFFKQRVENVSAVLEKCAPGLCVCVCVDVCVCVCVCVYRCQKAELCETHSESEEKNNAGVPERSER